MVDKQSPQINIDDLVTTAVFSCIVSSVVAGTYYISRLDFDDRHFSEITKCLCLSWLLTCSGVVWRILAHVAGIKARIPDAMAYLCALSVVVILGVLTRFVSFDFEPLLRLTGMVLFVGSVFFWSKRISWGNGLLLTAVSAAFASWVGFSVFGSGYHNPLFNEMLVVGEPPLDTLFHVSVANMLLTNGTPSTGLDGVPYLAYHFGSHWLFAQFSQFLRLDLLHFYNLGFPTIFIPFMLNATLIFALSYRVNFLDGRTTAGDSGLSYYFWLVFILAHLGIVPAKIHGGNSHLVSESYALGITAFFLFSSVALHLWRIIANGNPKDFNWAHASMFLTIGVMLAVVGLFKSSLMILSFILAGYLVIRIGCLSRRVRMLFMALNTMIVILVINLTVSRQTPGLSLEPFHYLKNYVQPEWWPLFPVFELLWSWVFILLRTREQGLATWGSMKGAIISHKIIDVECVVVVSLAGLAPGLLMAIPGGSAAYFSDFQKWLSVGLILANMNRFKDMLTRRESVGARYLRQPY